MTIITIARNFHTLLLENVPVMHRDRRDHARRFNTLVDALYDQGTGLIISAEAEPDALYTDGRRRRPVQAHRLAADGDALGELPHDRPAQAEGEAGPLASLFPRGARISERV